MFPSLKLVKLLFMLAMVTHWVGCCWFLIGYASILSHKIGEAEAVSRNGVLRNQPAYAQYPSAPESSFGDSWLLRHFGPKDEDGGWPTATTPLDPLGSVAYRADAVYNVTVPKRVEVGQIYFTSLYWSLTMLMKSPHIGPDTWIEKLFACFMVLLGLFVTTQIVAVVTQMVLSFDKAGSTFRDRQQEYIRFASSRALPPPLRRKLLKFSLQEWGVNQGFDPLDVIKAHRLPPALSNSILASIYDDVISESPLLKLIETPVLHELLKYVKMMVSLQKETLVNQSDPCTRLYILRSGSLQASATDKLMQQAQGQSEGQERKTKSKMARQSTWKQKMQVRMIERPGELICCASPFEPPHPLPFQVTSLSKTTLLAIHMQDLLSVLDIVSPAQSDAVCKQMQKDHQSILKSVMPKSKESMRESRAMDDGGNGDADANKARNSAIDGAGEPSPEKDKASRLSFDEGDLGERRLANLEHEVDRCIENMAKLHNSAKAIPRIVAALSAMYNKPMQPMGPAAMAALKSGGGGGVPFSSPAESEIDALQKEVDAA